MKIVAILMVMLLTSACAVQPPAGEPPVGGPPPASGAEPRLLSPAEFSYAADNTEFANPERGFHTDFNLASGTVLSLPENITLVRSYVRLDEWRYSDLPPELLTNLQRGFDAVRLSGAKVIPRFTYNFPSPEEPDDRDAPIDGVLSHIRQLAPLLQANADVIAVLQAGFIGRWGEWHHSTHDLDSRQGKRIIGEALLTAMPASRMVQIRTPFHIRHVLPDDPLFRESIRFSGSDQARIGFVNDCFLSGTDDVGTYAAYEDYETAWALTPFTVTGGETCDHPESDGRQQCPNALDELALYHWDYLNLEYYAAVLNGWRSDGCFEEISRRLGYRFELERASLELNGHELSLTLDLYNSGFGKLYNPRPLELVFSERSGQHAPVTVQLSADARMVMPLAGDRVSPTFTVWPNLPPGLWEVQLNLPDAAESLRSNPAYSIRLASLDADGQPLWLAGSGRNRLGFDLQVPVN